MLERIKNDPRIVATKKAYRTLGKDSAQFRPSSDRL